MSLFKPVCLTLVERRRKRWFDLWDIVEEKEKLSVRWSRNGKAGKVGCSMVELVVRNADGWICWLEKGEGKAHVEAEKVVNRRKAWSTVTCI